MRFTFLVSLLLVVASCSTRDDKAVSINRDPQWLNHSDTAAYVGIQTCRQCHQDIYNSFIETGMGRSFEVASRKKSSADFSHPDLYDKHTGFNYHAFWNRDSLYMREFRLLGGDTVYKRTEQVNYIIGSGQHTNSHLQSVNGYINQMPMTYYTQSKRWDLPPGFENGVNTRFTRKIGLECMSCHNALPEFVMGSENKYRSVPQGINCERCHGPGSIHVAQRMNSAPVDTSRYIDYSIVNPGKLSADLQFDICQRCHLQGNAVLKEGKSFFDFRPGMKLSDYMSVFLPRYSNADDEFIMASHADRLKQSACYFKSMEKGRGGLHPAKGALTCVTCHNPHVSVRKTNPGVFNDACRSCHAGAKDAVVVQALHPSVKNRKLDDCVSCHMPSSGSTDIPHVTVHDHYIRKPVSKKEQDRIRTFLGLYSINEKNPDAFTRARAYIDQYDKFSQQPMFLDSAEKILSGISDPRSKFHLQVHLLFSRMDHRAIISFVNLIGEDVCFRELVLRKSYDNRDGWTAYRVAEAFNAVGQNDAALRWFTKAVDLAPYNLDFRNKQALALAAAGRTREAMEKFESIIAENSRMVSAYISLGYLRLLADQPAEAFRLYNIALQLDPDNEQLLLNLAGYSMYMKNPFQAGQYLKQILSKNPNNARAKTLLGNISKQHV